MQHLGDITKISGYHAPVVDCIIGGSPCQDLSVAGKRAGLAGERSGLFMEQIRTVKEMRQRERDIGRTGQSVRPRYMVWENVPGAFSSNQGKDFAAVLEETIRIAEPEAPDIPVPEKGWPTSGCFMGRGFSVAWRVLDAQFWGVPQRRRRIALVADFGGLSAPEILFERKGLRGDFEESGVKKQEIARTVKRGAGTANRDGEGFDGYNGELTGNVAATLGINCGVSTGRNGVIERRGGLNALVPATVFGIGSYHSNAWKSDNPESGVYVPVVVPGTTYTIDRETFNCGSNFARNLGISDSGIVQTLKAVGPGAVGQPVLASGKHAVGTLMANAGTKLWLGNQEAFSGDYHIIEKHCSQYIVRRLTPLECERLQGFPDGWTDIGEWVDSKGKKHKEADSPRYKALGNSIALPPWKWVLKRICAQYERDATMASLFDGIGGFPLIWEQLNGKGSCLWASEIEEFPIAVTKLRFGGD